MFPLRLVVLPTTGALLVIMVSIDKNETKNDGHLVLGGDVKEETMIGQLFERTVEEQVTCWSFCPISPPSQIPFPDQTPLAMLERWREILVIDLTPAWSSDVFNPLALLLSDPVVADLLQTFVYMRTDVELMIMTTTAPTVYGLIAFAANPGRCLTKINPGSNTGGNIKFPVLSHDPVLIDVATQNQVMLDVPWVSPAPFNYIGSLANGDIEPCSIAWFASDILDLGNSTSQTVRITIKGRFKNPQVSGFKSVPAGPLRYQAQSKVTFDPAGSSQGSPSMGAVVGGLTLASKIAFGSALGSWIGGSKPSLGTGSLQVKSSLPDDPQPSEVEEMKQSVYGDLVSNHSSGFRLASSSLRASPNTPLIDILRKPSLLFISTLTSTPDDFKVVPNLMLGSGDYATSANTRLNFYSRFFRYWRGSITYLFRFVSSPMMSYKVGITMGFATTVESSDFQEDTVSRFITVRGTTDVAINVPYMHYSPWSIVDPLQVGWNSLSVKLIDAPIVSLAVSSPTLPYLVWVCAGPDFQFSALKNFVSAYVEPPPGRREVDKVVAQCSVASLMRDKEEPFFQGTTLPRPVDMIDVTYVEDIGRRYSTTHPASTDLTSWIPDNHTGTWQSNVEVLRTCFLFSRGEMDWMVKFPASPSGDQTVIMPNVQIYFNSSVGCLLDQTLGSGCVKLNPTFGNVLKFTTPFYCLYDLVQHSTRIANRLVAFEEIGIANVDLPTSSYGMIRPLILNDDDTTPVPVLTALKLGNGFGFYYEIPPPYRSYVPSLGVLPMPATKVISDAKVTDRSDGRLSLVHKRELKGGTISLGRI